jgi:hypothetical protein
MESGSLFSAAGRPSAAFCGVSLARRAVRGRGHSPDRIPGRERKRTGGARVGNEGGIADPFDPVHDLANDHQLHEGFLRPRPGHERFQLPGNSASVVELLERFSEGSLGLPHELFNPLLHLAVTSFQDPVSPNGRGSARANAETGKKQQDFTKRAAGIQYGGFRAGL